MKWGQIAFGLGKPHFSDPWDDPPSIHLITRYFCMVRVRMLFLGSISGCLSKMFGVFHKKETTFPAFEGQAFKAPL